MKAGGIALALSILALGAAIFTLTRESSPPPQRKSVRTDRVAALEMQVAELTREIESLKTRAPQTIRRETPELPSEALPTGSGDSGNARTSALADVAENDPALAAIVDDAVDRKTKQVLDELRLKANKKPDIGVFASTLELTEEQRASTERVVVEGQREVHAILDTAMADGTNPLDELVEIVARGMARPGTDPGWRQWFVRVVSEKIPGTNETYGARIEAVKQTMRATFKREWSPEQFREFHEWGVDPTEVQEVPGSPNKQLEQRIVARARELGAEIPDDDER
jgi:hypothetical protein